MLSPFATTVPGDTLLTVPPVNKTAMEGDTVTFDCVAKGEGTVVNWFREEVLIPEIQVKNSLDTFMPSQFSHDVISNLLPQQDLKRRASIGSDGTLTINSAAMGDLGEYTCVVTGENGDQQSASAFLNVQCERCSRLRDAVKFTFTTNKNIFYSQIRRK